MPLLFKHGAGWHSEGITLRALQVSSISRRFVMGVVGARVQETQNEEAFQSLRTARGDAFARKRLFFSCVFC